VLRIEDPYNYRKRPQLRMPKYMINASGDQFFLPDGSQFYYADLPDESTCATCPTPNTTWPAPTVVESELAFYQAIVTGTPRPRFTWKKQSDGSLTVTAIDKPAEVHLWQATNPEARDFRVDTIGNAYHSTSARGGEERHLRGKGRQAGKGIHRVLCGDAVSGRSGHTFKFTTR